MNETNSAGIAGFDVLRQTGRNLWLAGLGALAEIRQIEEEGRGLFDRLVERGRPLEERQKQVQKQAMDELGDLGRRAGEKLREMGELVRDQVRYDVKQAMQRVGVPTSDDFARLAARLEALSAKIDEIARSGAAPAWTAAPDVETH